MTRPATATPPLTISTKLIYGLGSIAYGVKDSGFQTFLLLFYNQVVGVPAGLVGSAIMIALVVDACADPIVGYISDNWHSRLGRRHPFMYAAALPVALSYLILWMPPSGWSHAALFGYILVVAIVVRTCITLYEIPSTALIAELTDDYDQRTSIISYRAIFAWWGGLGITFFAYFVFFRSTAAYPAGQLNPNGYFHYGLMAATVMLITILVSSAGTQNRVRYLRQPVPRPRQTLRQIAAEIGRTLSNRALLAMLGAGLFSSIGGGVVGALNLYLSTYFWELSTQQISFLIIPALAGSLCAMVLVTPLSRRFGKKMTAISLLGAALVLFGGPVLLRLIGLFPDNGTPWIFWVLVFTGFTSTALGLAAAILVGSMIADVVEDNEIRTGHRSEGLFFSANSFIQKAVSGTGIFISGMVLAFARFPQHARPGHVDPHIIGNLGITYLLFLAVFFSAALLAMVTYKISRSTHQENLKRLADATTAAAKHIARTEPVLTTAGDAGNHDSAL